MILSITFSAGAYFDSIHPVLTYIYVGSKTQYSPVITQIYFHRISLKKLDTQMVCSQASHLFLGHLVIITELKEMMSK